MKADEINIFWSLSIICIWSKFLKYLCVSKKFCKEHNLEQSDCVGFAFGGDEHKELNRGTEVNRLCISKHIGDYIH